jgi:hypothetical protein
VDFLEQSVFHKEGGWPKEIDSSEFEQVSSRKEKKDCENRRKVRPIEGNAKYRHLKKLTRRGTLEPLLDLRFLDCLL